MKKKGGKKKRNILKKIIIILLILSVIIIVTKFSNAHQVKTPKINTNTYYTGEILKPNYSASLLDKIKTNTNIVISPININTSINQLYNMQIDNEKIGQHLKLSIAESNELEVLNQENLKIKEKEITKYDELYLLYNSELEKYNDYTLEDVFALNQKQKENLILLLIRAKKTYETIHGITNNSVKFIKEYKPSKEELNINDYAIYKMLIDYYDAKETYNYQTNINNYSETIYNNNLVKKEKKQKKSKKQKKDQKQKTPKINSVNLKGISFSDKRLAIQEINDKVRKNTNNKINYIVIQENIEENELIQINSFNFESLWKENFNKEFIWDSEWITSDNKIEIVEMLHEELEYYYENNLAYAFSKSFKDSEFEFVAILPKKEGDFKLSTINIEELLKQKKEKKVSIAIPKFSIKYQTNLKELYNELGINTDVNIKINKLTEEVTAKHILSKTMITIDEKGTYKSNVRSSQLEIKELNDTEQQIFLNRPFAFMIRDMKNNTLLIGKVMNPNLKE